MRKTCWDPHYRQFHGALIVVLQRVEFWELFSDLISIYLRAELPFPGMPILEVANAKVFLTHNTINIVREGEKKEIALLPDEQKGISEFSAWLRESPMGLSAVKTTSEQIRTLIQERLKPADHYLICLREVIRRFVASFIEFYMQRPPAFDEMFGLIEHEEGFWRYGIILGNHEGLKIYWKKDELIVILPSIQEKGAPPEILSIADADFEDRLTEALKQTAPQAIFALPMSIEEIQQNLIKNNNDPTFMS